MPSRPLRGLDMPLTSSNAVYLLLRLSQGCNYLVTQLLQGAHNLDDGVGLYEVDSILKIHVMPSEREGLPQYNIQWSPVNLNSLGLIRLIRV